MPTTNRNKRVTPKIRMGASGRTKKQETVCQRGTTEAHATPIVADSIYSLKMKPKNGPEVYSALTIKWLTADTFQKLYDDIFPIYANFKMVKTGQQAFNSAAAGIELNVAFYSMLKEIKRLLPNWMEINFEKNEEDDKYYIVAFAHVEFKCFWHTISIKPIVKKLKKENKALHDLFINFCRSFSSSIDAPMWYNSYMEDHYSYVLMEQLEQYREERDMDDPEDVAFLQQYEADINSYKNGEAAEYEKIIKKAKSMSGLELMRHAKRFKPGHPIANLIFQGAFLMTGFCMSDYNYFPFGGIEENCHLSLDWQLNIIWDDTDNVTREYDSTLDAHAQEGIQEPFISFELTETTKDIDYKRLEEARKWPLEISNYFQRANVLINQFLEK